MAHQPNLVYVETRSDLIIKKGQVDREWMPGNSLFMWRGAVASSEASQWDTNQRDQQQAIAGGLGVKGDQTPHPGRGRGSGFPRKE